MNHFLRALRFSLVTLLMSALLPNLTTAQEAFVMKANGEEYPVIAALFGEPGYCNASGLTAEWVIALDTVPPVTDACQAPMNDLMGKIALVDRGMCSFDSKCLKAQQAGAIAVIVCNNSNVAPIAMGIAVPSISALINIPCFMASKQDCDVLRLLTPLEISVVPVYPKFPKAKVLWGKYAGQGDFGGGLNGWTVQNATCSNGVEDFEVWRWDADGVLNNNPASEGAIAIHAPSACNGAAFFDSRLYDATSQPPCTAPQSGELVSPVINLSNVDVPGVSLQFFQVVRN
ncbi:MAG: PA domain-containing protein, partial [Saprospiraceae bacterium]